jgi:hypothetical protein
MGSILFVRSTTSQETDGLAPCVLESPSLGDHSVLLHNSSSQVVNVARVVDLPRQCSCLVGGLLSSEDMEVVVSRMSSSMALGADG